MRLAIGIVLILLGAGLGLYAGVWWAFIGGIIEVVDAVRAEVLDGAKLGYGIARIVLASPIGFLSGAVLVFPGCLLIGTIDGDKPWT